MVRSVFILFVCTMPILINSFPPEKQELDTPLSRQRFAEFYCYKLRTCTPGGAPVCGFDDFKRFLAEFEDLCTLYKINCERKGIFVLVEENICEGQKRYQADSISYDVSKDLYEKIKNKDLPKPYIHAALLRV